MYQDIREKRYTFGSVTLIKTEFIDIRFTQKTVLNWIFTCYLPDIIETLQKTQYRFVKKLKPSDITVAFELAPIVKYTDISNYYFLDAKYKLRKELEKCE